MVRNTLPTYTLGKMKRHVLLFENWLYEASRAKKRNKVAFFLLTRKPNPQLMEFIEEMNKHMPAYLVVDDNKYRARKDYIIQQDDKEVQEAGFSKMNPIFPKPVTSWEKVIYTLCRDKTDIDFAWIVEEDVFIPSIESFLEVNKKYNGHDLVSASHERRVHKNRGWAWWLSVPKAVKRPHFRSLLCAVGMSRELLDATDKYAIEFEKLFMQETFFNTICHRNKLSHCAPEEFKNIVYREDWEKDKILQEPANWFHPIKDPKLHIEYRKNIADKQR